VKTRLVIGVLLIVAGVLALVYESITYTRREEVLDLGPLGVTAETRERIPLSPVLGVIGVGAGVLLLLSGARRNR
jgi:hypothetical protein